MKLLPCMWPKNPPLLHLKVLVDTLLNVLLRVTYVFVPIYHKNIFNCLTTLSPDKSWPWVEVLLCVLLKLMGGSGMRRGMLNSLRKDLFSLQSREQKMWLRLSTP